MRIFLSILRAELRLRLRSTRFRLGVGLCVALGAGSGIADLLLEPEAVVARTASLALAGLSRTMPLLACVVGVLVAGEGCSPADQDRMRAVLASSPISNAGIQVRRGLALVAISAGVSLVPFLIDAILALALRLPGFSPRDWTLAWGLLVLPRAVVATLGWFGLVTMLRSELAAFLVAALGWTAATAAANEVLLRLGYAFPGSDLLRFDSVARWTEVQIYRLGRRIEEGEAISVPATSGSWDAVPLLEGLAASSFLVPAAVALLLWLVSVHFLGRTRRDVVPRPIREGHPAPNVGRIWNRIRQERAPDASPGRADVAALAVGLLAVVGAVSAVGYRHSAWKELGRERYVVEVSGEPAANGPEVRGLRWSIDGRIRADGRVDVRHEAVIRNDGDRPLARVATQLQVGLGVSSVESPGRTIETSRSWDRLVLRWDPPLPPGETIAIRLESSGIPIDPDFRLIGFRSASFAARWGSYRGARYPRESADFSATNRDRRIGPRGVHLRAPDLAPRLRYTTWELAPPPSSPGEPGLYVREEEGGAPLDLEVRLEVPPGWVLVDSCGEVSRGDELSAGCRTRAADWRLLGGPARRLDAGGLPAVVLPEHVDLLEDHLATLERAATLARRAWPGAGGFEDLALLEDVPRFSDDLRRGMVEWDEAWQNVRAVGKAVLLPEARLLERRPFEVDALVSQVLSLKLLERREIPPEEAFLLQEFLEALVRRGMGLDDTPTAVVAFKPFELGGYRSPVVEAEHPWSTPIRKRLPALLADLEGRVGRDVLRREVERFLADGSRPPTFEGLFRTVEEGSGADLRRFWDDFLAGSAVPVLKLGDVGVERLDGRWVVAGSLRNEDRGEVFCPIVIETGAGERVVTVRADGDGEATRFSVELPSRPETLVLDPRETCHRWRAGPAAALEERVDLLLLVESSSGDAGEAS